MLRNFSYQDVEFRQSEGGGSLAICGEITNRSGRNYHSVVFRVILFIRSTPIGNENFTINGFINGQTRKFAKSFAELEYARVGKDISHYEIYPESGY